MYVAVVATFLLAAWAGRQYDDEWWGTGWSIAAFGGLCFASLTGMPRLVWADWRWLGVAASLLGWILVMMSIWGSTGPDEEPFIVITGLAVVVAHASLAALVPLRPNQLWLRIATVAAVIVAALFLDLEIYLAPSRGISILGRVAGAAGILASCGSLALVVLARLNRSRDYESPSGQLEITHITLFCPRCRKKQSIALGEAECSGCGIMIRVDIAQ